MKYYGKKSLSSVLKLSIDVLIVIGIIMYIALMWNTLFVKHLSITSFKVLITCVLFACGSFSLFVILFVLREILNTIIKSTPFVHENVVSLRKISICCFIIFTCYIINFFLNGQYINFNLVDFDLSGIHTHTEFIIFFFAGLFLLILAEIFNKAVKVKEENDFTI